MSDRVLAPHLSRLSGVPLTDVLAAVTAGDLDAHRQGELLLIDRDSAARWLATLSRDN